MARRDRRVQRPDRRPPPRCVRLRTVGPRPGPVRVGGGRGRHRRGRDAGETTGGGRADRSARQRAPDGGPRVRHGGRQGVGLHPRGRGGRPRRSALRAPHRLRVAADLRLRPGHQRGAVDPGRRTGNDHRAGAGLAGHQLRLGHPGRRLAAVLDPGHRRDLRRRGGARACRAGSQRAEPGRPPRPAQPTSEARGGRGRGGRRRRRHPRRGWRLQELRLLPGARRRDAHHGRAGTALPDRPQRRGEVHPARRPLRPAGLPGRLGRHARPGLHRSAGLGVRPPRREPQVPVPPDHRLAVGGRERRGGGLGGDAVAVAAHPPSVGGQRPGGVAADLGAHRSRRAPRPARGQPLSRRQAVAGDRHGAGGTVPGPAARRAHRRHDRGREPGRGRTAAGTAPRLPAADPHRRARHGLHPRRGRPGDRARPRRPCWPTAPWPKSSAPPKWPPSTEEWRNDPVGG